MNAVVFFHFPAVRFDFIRTVAGNVIDEALHDGTVGIIPQGFQLGQIFRIIAGSDQTYLFRAGRVIRGIGLWAMCPRS